MGNFTSPRFYPWERAPVPIESVCFNIFNIHRREKQHANFMSASMYFFTQVLLFLQHVNKRNFISFFSELSFSAGARYVFYVICKTSSKSTKMTNKMQLCRIIYCSLIALHVSSDVFARHQEDLNCIYSFWYYSRVSLPADVKAE